MPSKQDTYEFYDDHAICHSKSGNTYLIMYEPLRCTCVGFGYYQYCRHSKHVEQHSETLPPVSGDIPATNTVQDNIMHQLIHGKGKE